MKVAIAGTGNVAQYLMEEFTAYGHDIVVLTRRKKSDIKFPQRETDYSIASLVAVLEDRAALVSTVSDYDNPSNAITTHLNMLEALKQSGNCKAFIPSEWTLNVEDYPEQPMFFADANKQVHEALKAQTQIKWTIISNSWFADYIVPLRQRHLREIGGLFPMDHTSKTFTIYGPGTQQVSMTSARDVARAVAVLLDSPHPWDQYTYISAQQLNWNDLFAIVHARDAQWTSRVKPLASTIQQIVSNDSPLSTLEAYFEIESYAGALQFPEDKVRRHREKYFSQVKFRTVDEILDQAAARPDAVV